MADQVIGAAENDNESDLRCEPVEWMLGGPFASPVFIRKCFSDDRPPVFKVRRGGEGGLVLSKNGEWVYEPTPSSRDDEFYGRCRFETFDGALSAAQAAFLVRR